MSISSKTLVAAEWHAARLAIGDSSLFPTTDSMLLAMHIAMPRPMVRTDTWASFESHNRTRSAIPLPVSRIPFDRLPEGPAPQDVFEWWEARSAVLRAHGDAGTLYFSRPGWSPDSTEAIVELGVDCGPLCATGYLVILHRRAARWRVWRMSVLWVS